MATLKDVAKISGVSIKTVSRVVNNQSDVSPETRQKVQQAILELGYQPNTMARSLANGRTDTIGVIIPYSANYVFTHPFFTEVLRGIAEVLSANNLNILLHLAHGNTPYVNLYTQRQADGLILMSIPLGDPNLEGLAASGIPYIGTCRIAENDNSTHWVDADFAGGIEQAMEYLISLGHGRIALLTGSRSLVSVRLREQGYRSALKKNNLQLTDEYILEGNFTSESGHALATQAMKLSHPPSALICGDDMMAFGAVQALKELDLRVPEDVSVVGFDDVSLARFSSPPLTTIRQDTYQKGRIAAETLLSFIRGSHDSVPAQIMLDTSLVIRNSTAPAKHP
ncbi:MAG TPA: LacI family DNA-binding transcriptional regulator [Anaerolineales bacterium]|nr:LacI family DNA-binding transcriptional regulator [Anaerolineales bacterium]